MLSAEDISVKQQKNFILGEELEKNDSGGRICAKLAGSCFTAAI